MSRAKALALRWSHAAVIVPINVAAFMLGADIATLAIGECVGAAGVTLAFVMGIIARRYEAPR